MNREESLGLLNEWTESDSLRKHARRRVRDAREFGEDEEKWGITGLLHDMDYEKHTSPAEHPMVGVRELASRGYPGNMLEAIKGHADYLGVPRETLLAKTLYAVDGLSSFVTAYALPDETGGFGGSEGKERA